MVNEMVSVKELVSHIDIIQNMSEQKKVAKKLGFTTERVNNWLVRGIPARVMLDNHKLFKRYANKKPAALPVL